MNIAPSLTLHTETNESESRAFTSEGLCVKHPSQVIRTRITTVFSSKWSEAKPCMMCEEEHQLNMRRMKQTLDHNEVEFSKMRMEEHDVKIKGMIQKMEHEEIDFCRQDDADEVLQVKRKIILVKKNIREMEALLSEARAQIKNQETIRKPSAQPNCSERPAGLK